MIRFSASEAETLGLLRFLERRSHQLFQADGARRATSVLWLPLVADSVAELRPCRTALRLQRLLRNTDDALLWGVRLATDASHETVVSQNPETSKYHVDPEASRLILFAWGAILSEPVENTGEPERRREGIIELRDWVEDLTIANAGGVPAPKGVVFLPQTAVARDLVERCARRLRRRGSLVLNRWHVPPHLPPDNNG